ncbi:MAG: hypothetical protein ABL996_16585, partial [Micropepsaceae bacterium]
QEFGVCKRAAAGTQFLVVRRIGVRMTSSIFMTRDLGMRVFSLELAAADRRHQRPPNNNRNREKTRDDTCGQCVTEPDHAVDMSNDCAAKSTKSKVSGPCWGKEPYEEGAPVAEVHQSSAIAC